MFVVTGKLSDKSFIRTGVSEKGAWKIIHFLIEKTRKRKIIKIPLIARGKLAEKLDGISVGEKVVINFFIEGKKYNDKYFTDCIATDIDKFVPKSRVRFDPNIKDSDFEFNKDINLFNEKQ